LIFFGGLFISGLLYTIDVGNHTTNSIRKFNIAKRFWFFHELKHILFYKAQPTSYINLQIASRYKYKIKRLGSSNVWVHGVLHTHTPAENFDPTRQNFPAQSLSVQPHYCQVKQSPTHNYINNSHYYTSDLLGSGWSTGDEPRGPKQHATVPCQNHFFHTLVERLPSCGWTTQFLQRELFIVLVFEAKYR